MTTARKPKDMSIGARIAELFFGTYDGRYTKEEKARLNALGWHENEGSWAFFT